MITAVILTKCHSDTERDLKRFSNLRCRLIIKSHSFFNFMTIIKKGFL